MKKFILFATCLFAQSSMANLLMNPDFTIGGDGLDFWEAYDVPSVSALDPSLFVTAAGGTASIQGYSAGETAFYQTFAVAALASGTYSWSADIANIEDPDARMFIKVFTGGDFDQFNGSLFQFPILTDGTMALTYTHDSSDLVQFGFSGFSFDQGFDVSNLALTLVPEPASIGLFGLAGAMIAWSRRRRT